MSFATDVQPILTASCASNGGGCHPSSGSLNLESGMAYAALVNVVAGECKSSGLKYVDPGSPSTSYIIDKLNGTTACDSSTRMPLDGPPLSTTDIQTISDWICQGALNN